MFREWLGFMLANRSGISVCGEADNIAEAIVLIRKTKPDIVIVDLTLRGSSGLELVKDIKAEGLDVPVLVLSMHDEELFAERVVRAGARGFISKHEASSTLVKAVKTILAGQVYLPPRITAQVLEKLAGGGPAKPSGLALLGDRELEVFHLIGKGHNVRKIAEQLKLSESTVETYRTRIRDKLGIRSATELYQQLWISKV